MTKYQKYDEVMIWLGEERGCKAYKILVGKHQE